MHPPVYEAAYESLREPFSAAFIQVSYYPMSWIPLVMKTIQRQTHSLTGAALTLHRVHLAITKEMNRD